MSVLIHLKNITTCMHQMLQTEIQLPPNLLATKVKSQVNDTKKNQMCKFVFHMHFTMILKVVHRYVKSLVTDWLIYTYILCPNMKQKILP